MAAAGSRLDALKRVEEAREEAQVESLLLRVQMGDDEAVDDLFQRVEHGHPDSPAILDTISLTLTKNGDSRVVPLFKAAVELLRAIPRPIGGGRLFEFHDTNGLSAAFRRTCERASIEDLHFHDLRHEAASRLAPHVPATTLCKLMGWRSFQMSMRYYNQLSSEAVNLMHEIESKVVRAAA